MTRDQKHEGRSLAYNAAITGMFVAVIAVCSGVSIPTPSGVPITLQTAAIALCGYMLGARRASAAVAVYIIMGALGIPVFSNFGGGFGVLLGRTGGFIFGFLPMAALCGLLSADAHGEGRARGSLKLAARLSLGVLGVLVCHAAGSLQYALISGAGFFASALLVSVPYLVKDIVSVAAACVIAGRVRAALASRGQRI